MLKPLAPQTTIVLQLVGKNITTIHLNKVSFIKLTNKSGKNKLQIHSIIANIKKNVGTKHNKKMFLLE